MKTYYVTQEQLNVIEYARQRKIWTLNELINNSYRYKSLNNGLELETENALLRYLGGDETIEFKVKEPLYRLVGVNKLGQVVYFDKTSILLPATISKEQAFAAPLEEIEKWQTPDWNIERVDE